MSLHGRISASAVVFTVVIALVGPVSAWARGAADKPGHVVDAGSFGIFVGGKRVATEKFEIQQRSDLSIATSEIKLDDGSTSQKAELQISPSGELRRYEWHEVSPGKAEAVVEPQNEFLVEHLIPDPPGKAIDQPFLLPTSTMVLEDYFFVHREILAWRYLAQTCAGGLNDCKTSRMSFGVLVPRQRLSMPVSMQYTGLDKVMIRGAERQLSRFVLQSEAGDWMLWLDGDLKLIRVLIPGQNTEILRD